MVIGNGHVISHKGLCGYVWVNQQLNTFILSHGMSENM